MKKYLLLSVWLITTLYVAALIRVNSVESSCQDLRAELDGQKAETSTWRVLALQLEKQMRQEVKK